MARLTPQDLKTEDGVTFLEVLDDDGQGRTTKTRGTRRVPVHPELLRLGFVEYVEAMRKRGESKLFPGMKAKAGNGPGSAWGHWFSRYLRDRVGIKDSRKVLYAFRHRFKYVALECGIPPDHHSAICGHECGESSVSAGYGGELYPLRPLAESMARYRVAALSLDRLYPPSVREVAGRGCGVACCGRAARYSSIISTSSGCAFTRPRMAERLRAFLCRIESETS